ncbi:hypothetical protein S40285_10147 [Stachybotrys chlorohalonatus IBT 40285]|uniref:Collagen-like protein Mcl1 n=1 Tax=Stachybotrys chlorohalonatus (strain IBT 40285) TaxID=1283841 RepID=A0A084QLZ2_STAC4|nr:hypothetical protein S40285_10147 [Stachybotrys chlorohalonata IBT 40285]
MKHSIFVAAAALLPTVSARLTVRQDDDADENSAGQPEVCYPTVAPGDGTRPPCIEIVDIESRCQPNGTDSIDYAAHAQCMCNGSYFSDWLGCQDCLLVHGFRNERDRAYWGAVMSAASEDLCTGTPTAVFQSLFAEVLTNGAVPFVTTGETRTSDRFPDETAVSLYYTAEGTQGIGAITGSAAAATAEPSTESSTESSTAISSSTSRPSSTSAAEGEDEATTTESDNAAGPTQGPGIAMAIAGAVLMAAI